MIVLILSFVFAIPLILVNTFLWIRFNRLYRRRSAEKMPPFLFDVAGRWFQVLRSPNAEPDIERMRRQVRFSERLLSGPLVLALLGIGLLLASSRTP